MYITNDLMHWTDWYNVFCILIVMEECLVWLPADSASDFNMLVVKVSSTILGWVGLKMVVATQVIRL